MAYFDDIDTSETPRNLSPGAPILGAAPRDNPYQQIRGLDALPAASDDVSDASDRQNWQNTFTMRGLRWAKYNLLPLVDDSFAGDLLQPEVANERYGIAVDGQRILGWDKPVYANEAAELNRLKQQQFKDQFTISRRNGGLAQDIALGLGSFFTAATDPVTLPLNFVPGVGQARWAALAADATSPLARFGVRSVPGFTQGATATALLQPADYFLSRWEQSDFNMAHALENIVYGGLVVGGLHAGGGAIADSARGVRGKPGSAAMAPDAPHPSGETAIVRPGEAPMARPGGETSDIRPGADSPTPRPNEPGTSPVHGETPTAMPDAAPGGAIKPSDAAGAPHTQPTGQPSAHDLLDGAMPTTAPDGSAPSGEVANGGTATTAVSPSNSTNHAAPQSGGLVGAQSQVGAAASSEPSVGFRPDNRTNANLNSNVAGPKASNPSVNPPGQSAMTAQTSGLSPVEIVRRQMLVRNAINDLVGGGQIRLDGTRAILDVNHNITIDQYGNKSFIRQDPYVPRTVKAIDDAYPGHTACVNCRFLDPKTGIAIAEIDIIVKNAVIEVKSKGKGFTSQYFDRQNYTDLPVIAYSPVLKGSIEKSIKKGGGLVTKNLELLLEVIKP